MCALAPLVPMLLLPWETQGIFGAVVVSWIFLALAELMPPHARTSIIGLRLMAVVCSFIGVLVVIGLLLSS